MLYGRNNKGTGNDIGTFLILYNQVTVNTGTSLVQCSIVWNTSRE